jgi:hypothetical protein
MGYWGVAMGLLGNPFTWPPSPKALKDGWAAVEKARAPEAKTAREQAYIAAIETFYKDAETVEHRTRALSYEQAMAQLAGQYSEDREATIFYALALNATALPTDKTYANQLKAATLLEKVFAEQPQHPGVAHYLIHSYDYPPIAQRGRDAAHRYARIAPAAPHALHMPSHIFTRLGLWQESIDTNRASAEAARDELLTTHQQGALRGTKHVLKPGGKVAAMVYSTPEQNGFFSVPVAIIRRKANLPRLCQANRVRLALAGTECWHTLSARLVSETSGSKLLQPLCDSNRRRSASASKENPLAHCIKCFRVLPKRNKATPGGRSNRHFVNSRRTVSLKVRANCLSPLVRSEETSGQSAPASGTRAS